MREQHCGENVWKRPTSAPLQRPSQLEGNLKSINQIKIGACYFWCMWEASDRCSFHLRWLFHLKERYQAEIIQTLGGAHILLNVQSSAFFLRGSICCDLALYVFQWTQLRQPLVIQKVDFNKRAFEKRNVLWLITRGAKRETPHLTTPRLPANIHGN